MLLKSSFISLILATSALSTSISTKFAKRSEKPLNRYSSEANILQFSNFGYEGFYFPISEVEATDSETCRCVKDLGNPVSFEGPIAPLSEEVSVHFRGPLTLERFAWYVSDTYTYGDLTGNWTRQAFYDASSGTADNITFLGNVGEDNACLGKALDFVDSSGLSLSKNATVLGTSEIPSDGEFAIFSGVKCDGSDDCGAYRSGAQAYHGFPGAIKMFLFEFSAPTDTSDDSNSTNFNMPAIWLLNAQIPRTSQYPTNANCSAWASGAGEFDIFEVMNTTEPNHFYSTIHSFQGTSDLSTGLPNFGFLERTPNATMRGGVVFGGDGTATVFLSNGTSFNPMLFDSDVNNWFINLRADGDVSERSLLSVTQISPAASSTSASKSSKGGAAGLMDLNPSMGWLSAMASIILGALYI